MTATATVRLSCSAATAHGVRCAAPSTASSKPARVSLLWCDGRLSYLPAPALMLWPHRSICCVRLPLSLVPQCRRMRRPTAVIHLLHGFTPGWKYVAPSHYPGVVPWGVAVPSGCDTVPQLFKDGDETRNVARQYPAQTETMKLMLDSIVGLRHVSSAGCRRECDER